MASVQLFTLILASIALVIAGFAAFGLWKLQKLRQSFFAGKRAGDLEDFIINQGGKLSELQSHSNFLEETLKGLQDKQKYAIQKVGVIRYNPFAGDGGNLSFSIAILDDHENGVVITSMHARESNRVYAKPIKKGKSDFQLTKEEQQAIDSSQNL